MTLALPDLLFMITIAVEATAASYLLTGTSAGSIFRNLWFLIFKKTPLKALAFCPSCNAFWWGMGFCLLHSGGWAYTPICAIVASLAAGIVQSRYGLAAEDEKEIAARWEKRK